MKLPDVKSEGDDPTLKGVIFAAGGMNPVALVVYALYLVIPARWVVNGAECSLKISILSIRGRSLEVAVRPGFVRVDGGFTKEGVKHTKRFMHLEESGNSVKLRREGSRVLG